MSQPSPDKTPTGVVIPRSPTAATAPDPDLRSQINAQLIKDGHIDRIHNHLSHILSSDTSNWPTRIREHALALLRSGDPSLHDTFPKLMEQVLADIRADTNAFRREGRLMREAFDSGKEYVAERDERDMRGQREGGSLEIPIVVLNEGVRITRECLETVVELGP